MSDDMRDVTQEDISDAPSAITLDGVEYTVDRIRHKYWSASVQWLKDKRMQAIIDATRFIEEVSPESRGVALAKVACEPVEFTDVNADYAARQHLFSLCVSVRGAPLTLRKFVALPDETREAMVGRINSMGGGGKDSSDPPPSSISTGQ